MAQFPTKVFISYSHLDATWLERLKRHLAPVIRGGLLDCWDDTQVQPGDEWVQKVEAALEESQIVVLLISAAFFASDFIHEKELSPLLADAQKKGKRILPLLLSPCRFSRSSLAQFQAVNSPDKPLTTISL